MVQLAEQQHLDLGAGLFLLAVELGGKHLSIINDEHVAVFNIIHQVLENAVFDFTRSAVDDHQSGLVAVLRRLQRNQFAGQVEFEL